MKINRLIFPLVIALAAMIVSTGCKHGYSKTTELKNPQRYIPGPGNERPETQQPQMPTPMPYDPNAGVGVVNVPHPEGPIGTTTNWNPVDMNQDRATLAANMVHFKFDSSVVVDNEQANVSAVAAFMSGDAAAKLLIEGHCDERGTEEYNRSLGERRALALREALAKLGVDPSRIRTISYGKDRPADPGHDESAWAKNRRDDFVLLHPKSGA